MAATSPYQQNDYQAVNNFRPAEMPVNDIFKALVAQNQFWEIGAQRVKSVYDNALGLKLSLEPNKLIRNQFMRDAEKQLTKLSSMNLADSSVQRQGFNIFKPLFQDEGIMYDDAMTRHYEQVRTDALSYREKEGGKGYADTNMSYALDGYNEFINSKDRMAGKQFYGKRKEYTPFYDPTQELTNILKNCKPSAATNESVQGYYIKSYSNESLSAAKVNTCLDGGLSDRAKRQLQINGYVTYRNQPEALRDKYIPHLSGTVSQLQEENSAIKGVLANKYNLKTLKKEDLAKIGISDPSQVTPEFLQNLDNQLKNNEQRILNLNTSIGKMMSGDLSDITGENYENISGAIYSRDYMENVAEGFSYDFAKNSMKADPIQMMFYQQAQINSRQDDQQAFDLQTKTMELEADLAKKRMEMMGKGSLNLKAILTGSGEDIIDEARIQNDTNSPFTSIDKNDSYEAVTIKRQQIATKRAEINQWAIKELKSYGLDADVKRSDDPRFVNFWANFKATATSDPEKLKLVNEYEGNMGKYVALEDLYKNTQDIVDDKLKPLITNPINLSGLNSVRITGRDGSIRDITPQEVLDNITGKSNSMHINANDTQFLGFDVGEQFKGKGTQKQIGQDNFGKVSSLYNQVKNMNTTKVSAIKAKRNELMQSETVLQREGYNFGFLNSNVLSDPTKGESPTFKERMAQAVGLPLKYIDDLSVGQTDLDGRLIVTLNTDRANSSKEYDANRVLENLTRYGGRDNKATKDNKNAIVLEGINELDVIDENNLSSVMKPYLRTLESKATALKNSSTDFMRSMINNTNYRIDVSKSYNGGYSYKIIDEKDASSPVYSSSNRNDILAKFQTLIQEKKQINVPIK